MALRNDDINLQLAVSQHENDVNQVLIGHDVFAELQPFELPERQQRLWIDVVEGAVGQLQHFDGRIEQDGEIAGIDTTEGVLAEHQLPEVGQPRHGRRHTAYTAELVLDQPEPAQWHQTDESLLSDVLQLVERDAQVHQFR